MILEQFKFNIEKILKDAYDTKDNDKNIIQIENIILNLISYLNNSLKDNLNQEHIIPSIQMILNMLFKENTLSSSILFLNEIIKALILLNIN